MVDFFRQWDLLVILHTDWRILESGDRQAIRSEVRGLAEGKRMRGARFVMGVDHYVSDAVSCGLRGTEADPGIPRLIAVLPGARLVRRPS